MFSRRSCKTSFKDVFKTSSQEIFKVFSGGLQHVFQDVFKTPLRHPQDLFARRFLQDVFKTSSVRLYQDESLLGYKTGCLAAFDLFHMFIVYTINKVLYIPVTRIKEYRCLKNMIYQTDSKNEWLLLSASFTAKFGLVFVLTLENALG